MKIKIRKLETFPFLKEEKKSGKIDWEDTGNLFAWAVIVFAISYIFIYHGLIR